MNSYVFCCFSECISGSISAPICSHYLYQSYSGWLWMSLAYASNTAFVPAACQSFLMGSIRSGDRVTSQTWRKFVKKSDHKIGGFLAVCSYVLRMCMRCGKCSSRIAERITRHIVRSCAKHQRWKEFWFVFWKLPVWNIQGIPTLYFVAYQSLASAMLRTQVFFFWVMLIN